MTLEQERALALARARKRKAEAEGAVSGSQAMPAANQPIPQASAAPQQPVDIMSSGRDLMANGGRQATPLPGAHVYNPNPIFGLGSKLGNELKTDEGRKQWAGRAAILPEMLVHGATAGMSDEITGMRAFGKAPADPIGLLAAGAEGLIREATGNTNPGYDLLKGEKDERIQQNRSDFPLTSFGAETVGASIAPASTIGTGRTILGQAARTAAPSVPLGALYGYADAPEGNRGTGAAIGAGGGLLLGGGGGALTRAIAGDPAALSRVLDAEIVGPVSGDAAKVVERILIGSRTGITRDAVAAAIQRLNERVQGSVDGPALPTRFKDFLIEEFPEAKEGIQQFLRGVGRRGAQSGGDLMESGVSEDIIRLRQFFKDSAEGRLGGGGRGSMDDAADEAMGVLSGRYDSVFGAGPAEGADLKPLANVVNYYRDKGTLLRPLKEIAEGEMIDLDRLIETDPRRAAHWMQSAALNKADELDAAGQEALANAYRKMRLNLLKPLEADGVAPGYRETRQQYGDEGGFRSALKFGKRFFANAKDDLDFQRMRRDYDAMSPYQQEAAKASIRDQFILQGTEGNKSGANVRTTQVGRESALRGLRTMLGREGDAFASDIEAMMRRIDDNTGSFGISRRGQSQTSYVQSADQYAQDMASGPLGRGITNFMGGSAKDAGLSVAASAATGNTVVLPYNAAKGGMNALSEALVGRADKRMRRATELMMRDVTPGATRTRQSQAPTPPGGGGGAITTEETRQAVADLMANGYTRPDAERLAAAAPANALAQPPAPGGY